MPVRIAGTEETIALARARWLVAGGQARWLGRDRHGSMLLDLPSARRRRRGEVRRLRGGERTRWTAYSGRTEHPAWAPAAQRGTRMMGAALMARGD